MSTESIGQKLREARMRAGIPLEEASNLTKIKVRILEALEAGAIDQVPGGDVYARNFIRSYARFLGMDVDALLAEFDAARPEAAKPARVLHAGPAAVRWSEEPPAFTRRRGSRVRLWGAGAVVVVLAAVAVILVSWLGGGPGAGELAQSPPAVEQASAGQGAPEAAAQPQGEAAPAAGQESGTAGPTSPEVTSPAAVTASQAAAGPAARAETQPTTLAFEPLRIRTVVHQRSWMRVDVDGTTVYTGILEAGEEGSWTANDEIRIRFGYAQGVQVFLNDHDLGLAGQDVVTRTYTRATLAQLEGRR